MDLGQEIKIVIDDTIFDILDNYDDQNNWGMAEKLFNFFYYAKTEKNIPTETTEKVCQKGYDMWNAEFMSYISNVIDSNEIEFSADNFEDSVKRLAEISVVEYEEILVLSKREYSDFDDDNSILVWSPEQFTKFASQHSGFQNHIESMMK